MQITSSLYKPKHQPVGKFVAIPGAESPENPEGIMDEVYWEADDSGGLNIFWSLSVQLMSSTSSFKTNSLESNEDRILSGYFHIIIKIAPFFSYFLLLNDIRKIIK